MNIYGSIMAESLREIKECNMKGCIINSDKVSLADVFDCINDFEEYNCLITNIECYPLDEEISAIFSDEYCWIEGKKLLRLLEKENLQWIWGVFSVFPKDVTFEAVSGYNYPYADGYKGFWRNPIRIQHPLANSEIVFWDGLLILLISKNNEIVNIFMEKNISAKDLEEYNRS